MGVYLVQLIHRWPAQPTVVTPHLGRHGGIGYAPS